MHKKSTNSFEKMVEGFIAEFSKVENIGLLSSDEMANKIFKKITYRIADLNAYKNLVVSQFIPAINKAVAAIRNDVKKSKYKGLPPVKEIDFDETVQDTLRFAYVSVFHKLENYLTDVLEIADSLFNYSGGSQEPMAIWVKKKLGFDIKHVRQFRLIRKINFISNCVKHKDGYPLLPSPPAEYEHADRRVRIKLTAAEFKQDCEQLNEFYIMYLRTAFLLSQYQYAELMCADPERLELPPEQMVLQEETFIKLRSNLTAYIDLIRER
jgi:hypothetical protein